MSTQLYLAREIEEVELVNKNDLILTSEESNLCQKFYESRFLSSETDFNIDYISSSLKKKFYNDNVMKGFSCLIKSILQTSRYWGKNLPLLSKKIQQYFTNISVISSGVQGTALGVKLVSSVDDLLLIKVTNEDEYELLHEYLIGTYLNPLRSILPNFSYTYGIFRCDEIQSYLNEKANNRDKLCNTSNFQEEFLDVKSENKYTYYLISEFIKGKRLVDYVDELYSLAFGDLKEAKQILFSWLVQVYLALLLAFVELDYTHYDLHRENILIRETADEFVYLSYTEEHFGNNFYLRSRGVATIIDYGFSTLKDKNGQHLNSFIDDWPEYGLIGRGRVGNDIFRITGSVSGRLYQLSQKLEDLKERTFFVDLLDEYRREILEPLIELTDTPESMKSLTNIEYGEEKRFSLPIDDIFGTQENTTKFINQMAKKVIVAQVPTVDKNKILSCSSNPCDDFLTFLNKSVNLHPDADLRLAKVRDAVLSNNLDALSTLLEEIDVEEVINEVDPNYGKSLLSLAKELKYDKIVNLLEKNGGKEISTEEEGFLTQIMKECRLTKNFINKFPLVKFAILVSESPETKLEKIPSLVLDPPPTREKKSFVIRNLNKFTCLSRNLNERSDFFLNLALAEYLTQNYDILSRSSTFYPFAERFLEWRFKYLPPPPVAIDIFDKDDIFNLFQYLAFLNEKDKGLIYQTLDNATKGENEVKSSILEYQVDDWLPKQPSLDYEQRKVVVDWLSLTGEKFRITYATPLASLLSDLYLNQVEINESDYPVVAVASLILAESIYGDTHPLDDYIRETQNSVTEEEIREMIVKMIESLKGKIFYRTFYFDILDQGERPSRTLTRRTLRYNPPYDNSKLLNYYQSLET